MNITLQHLQAAWQRKDPNLVDDIVALARQPDPEPKQPIAADELTFDRFFQKIFSADFRAQDPDIQFSQRVSFIQQLEADQGSYPLPARYQLSLLLLALWHDPSPYARHVLMQSIRRLPIIYGVWKGLKHIYKAAEQQHDYPMLGLILARIDLERDQNERYAVSAATKTYMLLRGWRYYRRLGEQAPVLYPEAVVHYLAEYDREPESKWSTGWQSTWVLQHIAFHRSQQYGRYRFRPQAYPRLFMANLRAFPEAWQRDPQPLFTLMGLARAEVIRKFASASLRHDFKSALRDVPLLTLTQLAAIPIHSEARDELLVWLLQHSPKYEQQQFKALGLHDVIIQLLESPCGDAQRYACGYAKVHARDLDISHLLRLCHAEQEELRQLAITLLLERDPRQEIGLQAWGSLLDSPLHHKIAAQQLHQHFGRAELSADWFQQRLLSGQPHSVAFAQKYLLTLHPISQLGVDYFEQILLQIHPEQPHPATQDAVNFALTQTAQLQYALTPSAQQTLLLHALTQATLIRWFKQDHLKTNGLPMWYWQALACEVDWQQQAEINTWRQHGALWQQQLYFDQQLAETVRHWLADVRRFAPPSLGFAWLMRLAASSHQDDHEFAVERMIKAFVPADFAVQTAAPSPSDRTPNTVNLQGQSFLFTGKLSTMTRHEAEEKVSTAQGKNVAGVTQKLDYLVIGDEGSPLYGNGRKGSKQVKAESLIAEGAAIKIISETAFLQMLSGQSRTAEHSQTLAGCEQLWDMATTAPDQPTGRLAIRYLRTHHPKLALQLTDRPVDPDAEIPASFWSATRLLPLFQSSHANLRQMAVEIAPFELMQWSLSATDIVCLAESRFAETREFIRQALLPTADKKTSAHLDAATLDANAVYGLCESKHATARTLGLQLIQEHAVFQQVNALLELTESQYRDVRYSAIRLLWRHYQQPNGQTSTTPLPPDTLQHLLRRWLFELPAGRLAIEPQDTWPNQRKPLSASRAKRALIETVRDLAVDDAGFAQLVLPLFQTFSHSRGAMEQAACLVAATRIQAAHAQPLNH